MGRAHGDGFARYGAAAARMPVFPRAMRALAAPLLAQRVRVHTWCFCVVIWAIWTGEGTGVPIAARPCRTTAWEAGLVGSWKLCPRNAPQALRHPRPLLLPRIPLAPPPPVARSRAAASALIVPWGLFERGLLAVPPRGAQYPAAPDTRGAGMRIRGRRPADGGKRLCAGRGGTGLGAPAVDWPAAGIKLCGPCERGKRLLAHAHPEQRAAPPNMRLGQPRL